MRRMLALLLLLILPLAMASEFNARAVGTVTGYERWNISINKVLEDQTVVFTVWSNDSDAEIESVPFRTRTSIKGVRINTTEVFYDLNQTHSLVWFTTDLIWRPECNRHSDCNDGKVCTEDKCYGERRECHHYNISDCIDDDACCPANCRWLNDNDCQRPCFGDEDCDDGDESTRDYCDIKDELCKHSLITKCDNGDSYCPDRCFWNWSSGESTDNDCSKYSNCTSHAGCDDSDASTVDRCWGANLSTEAKYCQYTLDEDYEPPPEQDTEKQPITEQPSNKSKELMKWVIPKKLTDELKEKTKANWKLIALLSTITVVIYSFVSFKIIKVKTPPKEKF